MAELEKKKKISNELCRLGTWIEEEHLLLIDSSRLSDTSRPAILVCRGENNSNVIDKRDLKSQKRIGLLDSKIVYCQQGAEGWLLLGDLQLLVE